MPDSKTTDTKKSTATGKDQSQAGSTDPFSKIRSLHSSALEKVQTADLSRQSQGTETLVEEKMSEEDVAALRKASADQRQRSGPSTSKDSR